MPHPVAIHRDIAGMFASAIERCGPLTRPQLMAACGVSLAGSRYAIRKLKAEGRIYISGWKRGKKQAAIWSLGSRPDAEFVPLNNQQLWVMRRERERSAERRNVVVSAGVFGHMTHQLTRSAA